jgi:hypothetical protein
MSEKISGWAGFLIGLLLGTSIGGLIVYVIFTRESKITVKTFAYDKDGRLIQVMKQEGV